MNASSLIDRSAWLLLCCIVTSIPLVFGAVHPLILGLYVFIILIGFGGYLLFSMEPDRPVKVSLWSIVPVLIIFYLFLQIIPLPLGLLETLSPARAERLSMVNKLAGTDILAASISDRGSNELNVIIGLLAMLLYFFSAVRILRQNRDRVFILAFCLVGLGIFEAVYGLLQFVNPQMGVLWLKQFGGRAAHGTIIYKNQYASLMNMIWPLGVACGALYFMRRKEKRGWQSKSKMKGVVEEFSTTKVQAPIFLLSSALMLLAVLFSLSRGGILSMLFVSLLLLFLMPFARKTKALFFILFTALIIGYGAMLGLDTIVARFDSFGSSGATRIDVYLSSLPMLKEHWLTGIGLGSYVQLSPVYLKGFPAHILFDRVHNEYLETVIELGIPMGFLFFTWMFVGLLYLLRNLIKVGQENGVGRDRLALGVAAFCGLIGFLVHGLVDFGWRLPANLLYGVTLLAIVVVCFNIQSKNEI